MQIFAFDQNSWRLPARLAALAVRRAFIIEGPGRHHQKPGQREADLDVLEVWGISIKANAGCVWFMHKYRESAFWWGKKFLSMQGC